MTHSRTRRMRVVAAGLLAGMAIAAWWFWSVREGPSVASRVPARDGREDMSVAAFPAAVARGHTAARALPAVVPTPAAAVARCVEQAVKATIDGRAEPQCFGASSALQSGSVVAYRFESRTPGARWLIVEAAGREVVSVSIGQGSTTQFACDAAACAGVQVGVADLYGVRKLSLHGVQLPPAHASNVRRAADLVALNTTANTTADTAATGATLDGELLTTADDGASASASCAGQSVIVSTSAGAANRFCPSEGIAIRSNDDGGRTYRFADGESAGIAIEFDAAMQLRRIDYGAMSCTAPACASVEVGGAAGAAPSSIRFAGTMVLGDKPTAAWGTLVGQLSLPGW